MDRKRIAATCGLGLALVCLLVAAAPAAAAAEPGAPLALGAGYVTPGGSADVKVLQQRLRLAGQHPGPADGRFGPRTEAAVLGFQRYAGVRVDGIAGPRTQAALTRATGLLARGAGYGENGGSGQVRRLQRRLRRAGQRPGPVDGRFGPRTEAAVKGLQARTGLPVDGIVDRATSRALERTSVQQPRPEPAMPAPASPKVQVDETQPDAVWPAVAVGAIIALLLSVMLLAVVRSHAKPDHGLAATAPARTWPWPVSAPEQADKEPALEHEQATAAPVPQGGERDAGRLARAELPLLGYATAEASAMEFRAQAEAIDSECHKRGLDLLELVREREPLNGKGLARPGLGYALRRVSAGEAQGLVVADLERLTRSAAELGQVLESVLRSRGRLIVANAGLDTRDESGRLAARALIEVSGWERKRIADRTRKGLDAARRRRHEGADIRERIAGMRDEEMTLQAIADRLNQEGVPTLRGGKLWRPSSVQTAAGYRRPRRDPGTK